MRGTSIAMPEAGVRRLGIGVTGVGVRATAGGRFTIGGGSVSSAAEGTPINLVAAISFCAINGSVVG